LLPRYSLILCLIFGRSFPGHGSSSVSDCSCLPWVQAVPATIVGGIGGILAYQWFTGNFESWSYLWALIPGFVGLGIMLMSLMGGGGSVKDGASLLFISFILLAIFGSFFGAIGLAGQYWPVLLIALGVVLMVRSFINKE